MKKFIIYFFLFYLFAWKVVGIAQAQDKSDGVILTEQAQLIFDTTIHDWKDLYDLPPMSQIKCMAQNIYFEARAESMLGKTAVGWVTMNRVEDKRWPGTVCNVVHQGTHRESWKTKQHADLPESERIYYPKKHRCQFSWYCDGKKDIIWANYQDGRTIKENARAWFDSIVIALAVMTNHVNDNTKGSVYYYNPHLVFPNWTETQTLSVIIGNHTFMR